MRRRRMGEVLLSFLGGVSNSRNKTPWIHIQYTTTWWWCQSQVPLFSYFFSLPALTVVVLQPTDFLPICIHYTKKHKAPKYSYLWQIRVLLLCTLIIDLPLLSWTPWWLSGVPPASLAPPAESVPQSCPGTARRQPATSPHSDPGSSPICISHNS